jgi:DNA-binding transcriptional regulator YbjK
MPIVPTRREELLDAAIAVLGGHGARRITHRAVDAEAGVPAGSTSNYFRTRDALIDAVVGRFVERERAVWEAIAASARPGTPGELAGALAAFVRDATGPNRVVTLARYTIFVEAARRPRLQERLAGVSRQIRGWGAEWLRAVGSAQPERHAGILLDQLDGIILHQLAYPEPEFDPAGQLGALISALTSAPGRRERT